MRYPDAPAQSSFNSKSEGQNLRNSVFLKDSESTDDSCCGKCCKCFNLDNYKDNFKVDNDIVKNRIMLNLKFWSGGFFEDLKADYD